MAKEDFTAFVRKKLDEKGSWLEDAALKIGMRPSAFRRALSGAIPYFEVQDLTRLFEFIGCELTIEEAAKRFNIRTHSSRRGSDRAQAKLKPKLELLFDAIQVRTKRTIDAARSATNYVSELYEMMGDGDLQVLANSGDAIPIEWNDPQARRQLAEALEAGGSVLYLFPHDEVVEELAKVKQIEKARCVGEKALIDSFKEFKVLLNQDADNHCAERAFLHFYGHCPPLFYGGPLLKFALLAHAAEQSPRTFSISTVNLPVFNGLGDDDGHEFILPLAPRLTRSLLRFVVRVSDDRASDRHFQERVLSPLRSLL